jgi:hypothetical protein
VERTATPTPTTPPGFLSCTSAPPIFMLTNNNPHVGEQISWWATGLQTNTQVVITVADQLNPNSTDAITKSFTIPNNWCQAMGTLSFSSPIQYMVKMDGISSSTGQPVSLVSYPFAIPAMTPTPTPIPQLPPPPPSNIRITQLSKNSARVDWVDNSTTETGFLVVARTGQFQAPANTRTLNLGGLDQDQIYCFRVYAVNDFGRSAADVDCLMMKNLGPAAQ